MMYKAKHILGVRLAVMLAGVIAAGPCSVPAHAGGPELVERVAGSAGHVVWRIVRPRINQARTEYSQITFSPGSQVIVTASGCVQRGGHGPTWARYVDPAGAESDRLYHGQISIPGATAGLEFFKPTQPTVYTIPASVSVPTAQMHLILGYTDDGLNDNGYNARGSDDGDLNQCWQLGDASITIDITPLPPVVPAPAQANYTLTFENLTIRNLRSRRSDTLTLGSSVMIDGSPAAVAKQSIGDLQRGSHSLNFPILIEEVAPTDRLAVAYTIVNAGAGNAQQIDSTITGIIGKLGSAIPGYGQYISLAASIWSEVANLLDPNCDGPVVAGAVFANGLDLALWTQSGTYTRTLSFPGADSARGCGMNSFYEVTYSITRSTEGSHTPYSVIVNVPSRQSRAANGVSLIRR